MSAENLISISFSEAEMKTMKDAIASIAKVLEGKLSTLTPQQRQLYGRVKYEKLVWIDKLKEQIEANPSFVPAYIDKAEFDRDYAALKQLNEIIALLDPIADGISDTALLLGYDLDVNALMIHKNIRISAENNAPGAKTAYEVLKQQFPGGRKPKPAQ